MEIKLHSPVGAEPVSFIWSGPDKGSDIVETIRLVGEDLPCLKNALENNLLKNVDTDSYDDVKRLCDKYNKTIDRVVALEKGTSLPAKRLGKYPSRGMLKHILQQAYNRAVVEPDKLNQYEPFSAAVYGETSFELVCQILEAIRANANDVFIDLGSGVGQVVLQVAASTPCRLCLGIEKADTPSAYARSMERYFRQWMRFYGKKHGDFELIKGDFLSEEYRPKILSGSVVFVNNFAFGPAVDHRLKQVFAEMRDNTRILSSKSFCAINFRMTDRNLSDIGAIMHVTETDKLIGRVSWTDKPISYYLHVIDRTKLERYFQRLKEDAPTESRTDSSENGSDTEYTQPKMPKVPTITIKTKQGKAMVIRKRNKKRSKRNIKIIGLDLLHDETLQKQNDVSARPGGNQDFISSSQLLSERESNESENDSRCVVREDKFEDFQRDIANKQQLDEVLTTKNDNSGNDTNNKTNIIGDFPIDEPVTSVKSNPVVLDTNKSVTNGEIISKKPKIVTTVNNDDDETIIKQPKIIINKTKTEHNNINGSDSIVEDNKRTVTNTISKNNSGIINTVIINNNNNKLRKLPEKLQTVTSTNDNNKQFFDDSYQYLHDFNSSVSDSNNHDVDCSSLKQEKPTSNNAIIKPKPPYNRELTISALDKLLASYQHQFLEMLQLMKTHSYRAEIEMHIVKERERNERLRKTVEMETRKVNELVNQGVELLEKRMTELGIMKHTPKELFARARQLFMQHRQLQSNACELRAQIHALELQQLAHLERNQPQQQKHIIAG